TLLDRPRKCNINQRGGDNQEHQHSNHAIANALRRLRSAPSCSNFRAAFNLFFVDATSIGSWSCQVCA
uniref:Uncharacterized protein n=1 Tax=Physcomitrium patens TaxID=3218 RepID=A0A7I4A4Z5_PHYPA